MDALYGGGPQTPPEPLPSWLPQNVQTYMRTAPSYVEGQPQPSGRMDFEPQQPPNPTIPALRQQFRGTILRNAPTGTADPAKAAQLRQLYRMPGFSGFTGGDEI
jgi:hypothetical protein